MAVTLHTSGITNWRDCLVGEGHLADFEPAKCTLGYGLGEVGLSIEAVTDRYPDLSAPAKGIAKVHETELGFASSAEARQGR